MLALVPNNLPLEKTRFVGRKQLLASLRELARRPEVRLITLTGPGGSGKTRLALRAAGELLDDFSSGVFFVALAAVTDPEVVIPTIARTLGLKETAGQTAFDALRAHVAEQPFLLVLDNLEQVLGAAAAIGELLAACPGLKVLVTSRAVLHLTGEQELPVPPLAVPDPRKPLTVEDLAANEAALLFVERARAARPEFALATDNAAAIAEVCRRVDGLPLALELAAARLRALPLPALLQRLEHQLPILTGGPRDAPARQQTLRDTILWSYDLLAPAEQALFQRLAVFRGCTLDAVEDVCCAALQGPGTSSVAVPALSLEALDGVTSLVEKSLLRREETEDGQPWYVMLETVREFALERLAASGEEPALWRRHALYYLRLVEAADEAMHGPGQIKLLNRLEREHDNCREALRWCAAQGYAEPALRTAVALWWFWVVRGYASEGREWLTSLLQRFKAHGAVGARSQLRVRALEAAGHLASFQGDLPAARAFHQQNLPVVEEQGDASGLYRTLQNLGFVASQQEDWQAARDYLERCLAVAREGGDSNEIGNALHNLANLAQELGDHDLARSLLEESLPLFEQTGLARSQAIVHLSLSLVALNQGDYQRAHVEAELAIELHEEAGDRRQSANARANLASVAIAEGDFATAERNLCDSLRMLREVADPVATAGVLERFAVLLAAQGLAERALRLAGAAASLRQANGAQLTRVSQTKLEAELEPARNALGLATAATIHDAGRALTAAEAIGEALAEGTSSPAPQVPSPALSQSYADGESGGRGTDMLTPREREIACLVAQGSTNRQIADALVITEGTAANHVLHILNKLGFSSRSQIAAWAVQEGLLTPSRRG
ncbi:MAG TPA: tetratricopeptide repeat protein [Chloroflexota bacterium]|nr:tetratricopeptide repeat protein [Chloroflexota bacterium]